MFVFHLNEGMLCGQKDVKNPPPQHKSSGIFSYVLLFVFFKMLFLRDHPSSFNDVMKEVVTPLPHPPSLYSLFYK